MTQLPMMFEFDTPAPPKPELRAVPPRQTLQQRNYFHKSFQIAVEPIRRKSDIKLIQYLEIQKEEARNVFLNAI